MEVLLLRSIISFIWAHARDECSQTVSSAFTDRNQCWMPTPNSFLEQLLQETNIITNRFVLDQQKKEKCFEHGHNCKEVEGKRRPKLLKWWTVSSVTLCKIHLTPKCICSSNLESVAANNQKRQIVTAVFFFSFSLRALTGSLFWKEAERESLAGWMDGWIDGEKPHLRHWWKSCRLLGDRSTHGLRLPWEPGCMASRTDTGVFAFAQVWTRSDRYVSMTKREGWRRGNTLLLCPRGQFPQEKEVET